MSNHSGEDEEELSDFDGSLSSGSDGSSEGGSDESPEQQQQGQQGAPQGSQQTGTSAGGIQSFTFGENPNVNALKNDSHDASHPVEDAEHMVTPRDTVTNTRVAASSSSSSSSGAAAAGGRKVSASGASGGGAGGGVGGRRGSELQNDDHDLAFEVEDDSNENSQKQPGGGGAGGTGNAKAGTLQNNPSDMFFEVEDDEDRKSPGGNNSNNNTSMNDNNNNKPGASNVPGLGSPGSGIPGVPRELQNQAHDIAMEVESSARGSSPANSSPNNSVKHESPQNQPNKTGSLVGPQATGSLGAAKQGGGDSEDDEEFEEFEESDEELDGDDNNASGSQQNQSAASGAGGMGGNANETPVYRPEDYNHLRSQVSHEINDLFNFITAHTPQQVECPTKLRPFIPDYIPCIGDIDAFCKIPPPDAKPDNLGLVVLDEPSCPQSNATVVKNAIRSSLKISMGPPVVDSVEEAHTRPQVLDRWIQDLKNVPKPQTNVNYSKPMPDVNALLQEWPPEFEQLLASSDLSLPPPNIDLDMFQYVKLLCTLVDIPTSANLVESLHLLFSTYLDVRQIQGNFSKSQ